MKMLIAIALCTYLLVGVISCSISPEINQDPSTLADIRETMPSSTSMPLETKTIVPTQTRTFSPTHTQTLTPTFTPTATPFIKHANEVISSENVDQLIQLGQIGKGFINDIVWSSDGEKIILGTGSGIYIHNRQTLEQEIFIETGIAINSIDISPDNKTIISETYSGEVDLWDMLSGQNIKTFHKWMFPNELGESVAYSPDGQLIASLGMEDSLDIYAIFWDPTTIEESRRIHLGDIRKGFEYITFSNDGQFLAVGGTVWIMDRSTNKMQESRKILNIWDVHQNNLIHEFTDVSEDKNMIIDIGFSQDNLSIWAAYSNNMIVHWSLEKEELINRSYIDTDGVAIEFSHDGKDVAVSEDYNKIAFYHVETQEFVDSLDSYSNGPVFSVDILDDSDNISALIGSNFYMIDITLGNNLSNYFLNDIHNLNSPIAAISHDGKMIAYEDSSDDKEIIFVKDLRSGNDILTIESESINVIEFSSDNKLLAMGGFNNQTLLWDIETGTLVKNLVGNDTVFDISFSKYGQKLAVGSRNKVQIWDTELGTLQSTFTGFFNQIFSYAVVFSSDGSKLASGGLNGAIDIFDVDYGVKLKYLEGHNGSISSLAFAPIEGILASTSDDCTIRLWDVETGDEIAIIDELPGIVNSITFSRDGKFLISGGDDGIIRFWGIP